jgi:phosphoenolpyruvate carboxykinase (GTP)
VLAWIFRRCQGHAGAIETPTGLTPQPEHLDLTDLNLPPDTLQRVLNVDRAEVTAELRELRAHLGQFGDRLPPELQDQLHALERRIATP